MENNEEYVHFEILRIHRFFSKQFLSLPLLVALTHGQIWLLNGSDRLLLIRKRSDWFSTNELTWWPVNRFLLKGTRCVTLRLRGQNIVTVMM